MPGFTALPGGLAAVSTTMVKPANFGDQLWAETVDEIAKIQREERRGRSNDVSKFKVQTTPGWVFSFFFFSKMG